MASNGKEKRTYSSRFGLLCILVGGSVGTGNLWRYPRLVAGYGGGFTIVMVICVFILAIPIIYVENVIGRATRHSAPGAFRDMIGPKYTWMGTFSTIVYFLMLSYYMVVLGWCIRYTQLSITKGYFGQNKLELFNTMTNGNIGTAICWLIGLVLLYFCIRKQSSLEKASSVLLPALFVILIVLVVYALNQDGAKSGLEYAFDFSPKQLIDPSVWLDALTQAAWSIGPGTMMIVAAARYTAKDDDIALNTHIQSFGDMTVALLATLCVLPCIFAYAASKTDAIEICGSGSNGITFIGLTNMFEKMPAGSLIGTLFFICLSFAAFSSATLMATCFSNALMDLGIPRKKAVRIDVVALGIVGIPSVFSQDFLTNQDTVWGYGLIFGAAFLGILAHKYGEEKMRTQLINPVSDIKANRSFNFLAGRFVPVLIGVVMIAWCIKAIGWDDNWWNPFRVSSLGTMLFQWAIVFVISIALNKVINRSIKHRYFNGETFDDIPDELLNEE